MTAYMILKTEAVGDLLLTADATHLTGIYFAGKPHAPAIGENWRPAPEHPALRQAAEQVDEFLAGERTAFSLDLRATGTPLQQEVWRQIALIPFGQTITYTELAGRAGMPGAVRAAGTATGRNPHSIVVPCHRVVGKNGTLHGYAGGLDRKQTLLAIERPELMLIR